MTAATPGTRLAERLSGLIDLERSRGFHAGRVHLDLSRMEALLAALPPLARPRVAVHVAGSEGKTSTTELIAAGLASQHLLAATYTSPHLLDVRERLRIGGAFPPDAPLDAAVELVAQTAERLGQAPTFFEFLTAVARVLFAHAGVDAVVWETGLGGRLDATRLLPADACVITSISLEHTAILGDTLPAVAAEKAGILRPGAPVVLGADVPAAAREVIAAHAAALACPVVTVRSAGDDFRARNRATAAAALGALAELGLIAAPDAATDAALAAHVVAGRMHRAGDLLFDGAHTVAACAALARALAASGVCRELGALVFGATSGRDAGAMLASLLPLGAPLILTRAPGDRGVDPEELATTQGAGARVVVEPDPERALLRARQVAGPGRTVLVTGSLYLVGRLLEVACR
ncbi:MAG TPA: Mur ligase family protein [Planctomycetota bacterium]|nr:Mur ligase family protein [Planctomycetota bacterium]